MYIGSGDEEFTEELNGLIAESEIESWVWDPSAELPQLP